MRSFRATPLVVLTLILQAGGVSSANESAPVRPSGMTPSSVERAAAAFEPAWASAERGGLVPVAEVDIDGESVTVCEPKVVNEKPVLDDECINRIESMPYLGKRYNAIGREMKEERSLCNHMFLPRCRRKY